MSVPSETALLPDVGAMKEELGRLKKRSRFWRVFKSTVFSLIIVAAVSVLIVMLWMPVLQIYGTSMTPTLTEKDIVISLKGSDFKQGDIVGLYIGNKLLVKRVIAGPGQWVEIREDGSVFVDSRELDEPYVPEKALGDCNLEFPYQVPENRYFVMGDHRSTSADSRNTAVGCIPTEDIVGKIVFRVWPFNGFGRVE